VAHEARAAADDLKTVRLATACLPACKPIEYASPSIVSTAAGAFPRRRAEGPVALTRRLRDALGYPLPRSASTPRAAP
jgi:hypothetical protein